MTEGVTITFEMHLKPGMGDVISGGIPAMLDETATRPGFRDIRVVRHKDDPDRIMLIETWDTEADYRTYLEWRAARGGGIERIQLSPPVINIWPTTVIRR